MKILEGGSYDRWAHSLRAMALASQDAAAALDLAAQLPEKAWGAEVRLRVAGIANHNEAMAAAAKEFLGYSPDGAGRLLAAQALAQSGDFERAGEIAHGIARDPNCPAIVRSDGFHVAMATLADRCLWLQAAQTWEEWRDLGFSELPQLDGRISAWQVRVAHNRRRSEGGPGQAEI